MKTKIKLLLFVATVLLASYPVGAQVSATATPHSVVLNWMASSDSAANPSLGYQVYRLPGAIPACPVTPPLTVAAATGFQLISGVVPLNTTTYTDFGFPLAPIPPGNYCYFVVSILNGAQSVPSNLMPAVVLPAAPILGVPSPT
jgi:hypothetical protein